LFIHSSPEAPAYSLVTKSGAAALDGVPVGERPSAGGTTQHETRGRVEGHLRQLCEDLSDGRATEGESNDSQKKPKDSRNLYFPFYILPRRLAVALRRKWGGMLRPNTLYATAASPVALLVLAQVTSPATSSQQLFSEEVRAAFRSLR